MGDLWAKPFAGKKSANRAIRDFCRGATIREQNCTSMFAVRRSGNAMFSPMARRSALTVLNQSSHRGYDQGRTIPSFFMRK